MAKHYCCCEGQDIFCDFTCECNGGRSYSWLTNGFSIHAEKMVNPTIQSQACCFDTVNYEIDLVGQPIGQIELVPYDLGNNNCCWVAQFDMQVTGNVHIWFDFDVFSGPPLYPNCNSDSTEDVNETVPCLYTVCCDESGRYKHEFTVCHFQVMCEFEWFDNDCEENCNIIQDRGLRCAGGTWVWYTDAEVGGNLLCPDDSDVYVLPPISVCGTPSTCCGLPPEEFAYYSNLFQLAGLPYFFGMYTTASCSVQDPFPPCDPLYRAGLSQLPIISPIPFDYAQFCNPIENNIYLDNYRYACSDYYVEIALDTGNIV